MAPALARLAVLAASATGAVAHNGTGQVSSYQGYSFGTFLSEHKKGYSEEAEYTQRQALFEANLGMIREHNARYAAGEESWYMAMNHFGDWSTEEFKTLLASRPSRSNFPVVQMPQQSNNPVEFDWRTKSAITKVKNQGQCGSCWAFAAVESVESHLQIATGKLLTLSPQTYVNCVKNPDECGGTGGCEGATCELAFNLTVTQGVALEEDVPYRGRDHACTSYKPAAKATGYVSVASNDAQAFETALATAGPMSVVVAADSWMFYGGGILDACSRRNRNELDHGVQVVGYTKDSWVVRNSWGTGWGEGGFIRLSRKADHSTFTDSNPSAGIACKGGPKTQIVGGECGILFDASYPSGVTLASSEELVV